MKLNSRIATLTLLLLGISFALAAGWPKDTLEAQAPTDDGSWQAIALKAVMSSSWRSPRPSILMAPCSRAP